MFARVRLRKARLRRRSSSGIEAAPPNVLGGRFLSGSASSVSIRIARLTWPCAVASAGRPPAGKSYIRRQSASQLLSSRVSPPRSPPSAENVEHVLQEALVRREPPVPVVGVADHAVPEPERRDRELDRHGRYGGGRGVRLDEHPAVLPDVVERRGSADPWQVVVPDQPLVVQRDRPAGACGTVARAAPRRAACRPPGCGTGSSRGGSARRSGSRRCGGRGSAPSASPSGCGRCRHAAGRGRPWPRRRRSRSSGRS